MTSNPTATWAAAVVRRAFMATGRSATHLLRDRDAIHGEEFKKVLGDLGLKQPPLPAHLRRHKQVGHPDATHYFHPVLSTNSAVS